MTGNEQKHCLLHKCHDLSATRFNDEQHIQQHRSDQRAMRSREEKQRVVEQYQHQRAMRSPEEKQRVVEQYQHQRAMRSPEEKQRVVEQYQHQRAMRSPEEQQRVVEQYQHQRAMRSPEEQQRVVEQYQHQRAMRSPEEQQRVVEQYQHQRAMRSPEEQQRLVEQHQHHRAMRSPEEQQRVVEQYQHQRAMRSPEEKQRVVEQHQHQRAMRSPEEQQRVVEQYQHQRAMRSPEEQQRVVEQYQHQRAMRSPEEQQRVVEQYQHQRAMRSPEEQQRVAQLQQLQHFMRSPEQQQRVIKQQQHRRLMQSVVVEQQPLHLDKCEYGNIIRKLSNVSHEDHLSLPTVDELIHFENDIDEAQLLFWETSGLYRFSAALPTFGEEPSLKKEWLIPADIPTSVLPLWNEVGTGVSIETKRQCIANYQEVMNHSSDLLACGCCGVRSYIYSPEMYTRIPVRYCFSLRLTEEQITTFDQIPQSLRPAYSSYTAQDGLHYHLHRDLVQIDNLTGEPSVFLCKMCLSDVQKQLVPKLSIAAGYDFGNPSAIDLPELTLVEKYLIARTRVYIVVIKLVAPTGMNKIETRQSALRGHIISFPHSGPESFAKSLPNISHLSDFVNVVFLGTKNQLEIHMKGVLSCAQLQVRPNVVILWLKTLKLLNSYYNDIILDESEEMHSQLESIPALIISNMILIDDPDAIQIEVQTCADVAQIRIQPEEEVDNNDNKTHDVILTDILLTERDCSKDPQNAVDIVLKSIKNAVATVVENSHENVDSIKYTSSEIQNLEPITIQVQRGVIPLSEFEQNMDIFYGAFPYLFLIGKGFESHGSIPPQSVKHLLRQYSQQFACDKRFIFYLFNQTQRHAAAQGVDARLKCNPSAFEAFSEAVCDPNFQEIIDAAIVNPKGAEAKEVMKRLGTYIELCGNKVPFGPAERNLGITKLYSLVHRYGLPSIFLTISPDDVHSPMALRLCFPSITNSDHPAQAETFLNALRTGELEFQEISINNFGLLKLIAQNPVASAEIFNKMMETVWSALIGIKSEKFQKKTVPISSKDDGIFGQNVATFGVFEVQGRGSLHTHMCIWGSLTPSLLQKVASYPALVKRVTAAMDTMFQAALPPAVHLEGLMRRSNHIKLDRTCLTMSPDPIEQSEAYTDRVMKAVDSMQLHSHTETCRKGKHGQEGCRLAKPSGLIEKTCCVQLCSKLDDNAVESVEVLDAVQEKDHQYGRYRDKFECPVPPVDDRCLAWELSRPCINFDLTHSIQLQPEIESLEPAEKLKMIHILAQRNGSIVEFNDALTSSLGCNTAAYVLGGTEQSKAALFYLVKYLTKDSVALTNSLSIIHDARKHVEKYPSTAKDTGTTIRKGQSFLQRIINSLSGQTEVSATQAAASLLGMSSSMCSTAFIFVYINSAIAYARAKELDDSGQNPNHAWEGKDDMHEQLDSDDDDDENKDDDNEDILPHISATDDISTLVTGRDEYTGATAFGCATIFRCNGVPVPVPQYQSYSLRGIELQHLSLYEYPALISIVEKQPIKPETDQLFDTDDKNFKPGRHTNRTYNFDERHPLYHTHVQKIRSKQLCPILAGGPVPKYPGQRPNKPTASWRNQALQYSRYMLVLMRPWNTQTAMPGPLSWESFCQFCIRLSGEPDDIPTFLGNCITTAIFNITHNLRVNSQHKRLLTKYRTRAATQWTGKPDCTIDLNTENLQQDVSSESEIRAAEAAIDALRKESRADDVTAVNKSDQLQHAYLQNTLQLLDTVFASIHLNAAGDALKRPVHIRNNVANIVHVRSLDEASVDSIVKAIRINDECASVKDVEVELPIMNPDIIINSDMPFISSSDLNEQQQGAISILTSYLSALVTWEVDPYHRPAPQAPLLMIHGGPGVGKSHFARCLYDEAEKYGRGILCTAFTGVATMHLSGNPRTLHSLLSIPITATSMNEPLPPLSNLQM